MNRFGNYRCSICNCVNDAEIASDPFELKNTRFYPDPSDHNHFICQDCYDAIGEVEEDWSYIDEEDYFED